MGEAKSNPMAIAKAEGRLEDASRADSLDGQKVANPISVESILIITDLAQIGHTHLKQLLPGMREVVSKGDSALTAEQLNKFELLAEDGPEVIAHFSNMCKYIMDVANGNVAK